MTLVLVAMFLIIFVGLAGQVSRTYQQGVGQSRSEMAFQIAEAGLNYGRWRLAHDGSDFTPEMGEVNDQFAGTLGSYELTFTPQAGSSIVLISSTGTAAGAAEEVTLHARYGIPSLARYASITNGDVWYGGAISGAAHANGGIRMDGQSESLMTSAKGTYICQPHHDCDYEEKPGVWGSGTTQELWEFPVAPVNYAALTLDLLDLQAQAEVTNTDYGPSGNFGYHLLFQENNTYSIYRVTSLGPNVLSAFSNNDWQYTSHDIGNKVLVHTRAVPSGGVIFVDDNRLWVSGAVRDRVTVAAGELDDTPADNNADIIITGDISYGGVVDGSRAFGAVAQNNVLIPWSGAENELEINGAFIAQNGRFGRRYYPNCCGSQAHRLKASLVRYGMVASNQVPVTAWVDEGGNVVSGYLQGQATYDSNLLYQPPPYFPTTGQYQFLSWEEVD